jgi:hypothetical protein
VDATDGNAMGRLQIGRIKRVFFVLGSVWVTISCTRYKQELHPILESSIVEDICRPDQYLPQSLLGSKVELVHACLSVRRSDGEDNIADCCQLIRGDVNGGMYGRKRKILHNPNRPVYYVNNFLR